LHYHSVRHRQLEGGKVHLGGGFEAMGGKYHLPVRACDSHILQNEMDRPAGGQAERGIPANMPAAQTE
jgi:hypothetical protein